MMHPEVNVLFYMMWNMFDVIIILQFYQRVLGSCKIGKKAIGFFTVFFIFFFSVFLEMELPYTNLVNISACSMLFLLTFPRSVKVKLLVAFMQIALAGLCQAVPYFLINQSGQKHMQWLAATGHLLFFFVMKWGSRLFKVNRDNIKGNVWYILLVIPMASFFSIPCILLLALYSNQGSGMLYSCLITLLLLGTIINLASFYLFDKLNLWMDTFEQKIRLEEQLDCQTAYYLSVEENQKKISGIRHDMKNNLEAISCLLEEGNVEDARLFLSEIRKTVGDVEKIINTQNPPVDTILNIKINAAKEQQIRFNCLIHIPGGLPVTFEQMTAILGNLLDNAIEAQEYVEVEKREINLQMEYSLGNLMILIKNIYNEDNTNCKTLQSGKCEKAQHGLGLMNVKRMVEQMEGTIRIFTERNIFQVEVLLSM